jgi:type IV pilus assembly protein PilY1
LLATLADASGNAQPVTTAPLIEIHPSTRKRYVMVGTGKLLSTSDVISTAMQSFYVILDGTAGLFNPVSTPITRANLTQVTDVTAGVTLATGSKGWYIDLGITSGVAQRVILNPVVFNGIVSFATLLTSGDACSPTGQSQIYAVNYATATSVLGNSTVTINGTTVSAVGGIIALPSAVVNLKFASLNGKIEQIAGTNTGTVVQVYGNLSVTPATRLLNWREVPTVD